MGVTKYVISQPTSGRQHLKLRMGLWMVSHALWINQCIKHLHAIYDFRFYASLLGNLLLCILTTFSFRVDNMKSMGRFRQEMWTIGVEKLYINLRKCTFMSHNVVFLGFVVSSIGIEANPKKTKVIFNWHVPIGIHKVWSFHGLPHSIDVLFGISTLLWTKITK